MPDEEVVALDDFLDTAEGFARQYSTPPGGRVRPELLEPSILTRDTLESIVAFRVACQWFQHWIDSSLANDEESAERARDTLEGLHEWPIVRLDGLGAFYEPLIAAVRAGDAAAIQYHLDINCPDVRQELPGDAQ